MPRKFNRATLEAMRNQYESLKGIKIDLDGYKNIEEYYLQNIESNLNAYNSNSYNNSNKEIQLNSSIAKYFLYKKAKDNEFVKKTSEFKNKYRKINDGKEPSKEDTDQFKENLKAHDEEYNKTIQEMEKLFKDLADISKEQLDALVNHVTKKYFYSKDFIALNENGIEERDIPQVKKETKKSTIEKNDEPKIEDVSVEPVVKEEKKVEPPIIENDDIDFRPYINEEKKPEEKTEKQKTNTIADFGIKFEGMDFVPLETFEGRNFLTTFEVNKMVKETSEGLNKKTNDDLMRDFLNNFGFGSPNIQEREAFLRVVDAKNKETVSLKDAKLYNNFKMKKQGALPTGENITKGLTIYKEQRQRYEKKNPIVRFFTYFSKENRELRSNISLMETRLGNYGFNKKTLDDLVSPKKTNFGEVISSMTEKVMPGKNDFYKDVYYQEKTNNNLTNTKEDFVIEENALEDVKTVTVNNDEPVKEEVQKEQVNTL